MKTFYYCRHVLCSDKDNFFKTRKGRNLHEKAKIYHDCSIEFCSQCELWETQTRLPKKGIGDFKCGHSMCKKKYKHQSSCIQHEKLPHKNCPVECTACEKRRGVCSQEKGPMKTRCANHLDFISANKESFQASRGMEHWGDLLKSDEPTISENLFLTKAPKRDGTGGAIIPLDILKREFVGWWKSLNGTLSQSVVIEPSDGNIY